VDDEFNPVLIEVNSNPCLEFASPYLEDLIPRVINNALMLGLDPTFKPPLGANGKLSPKTQAAVEQLASAENGFEHIFPPTPGL
jgi:hypothetical protein